ncbi:MAG TPA: class I SAM-dependent methyltransferase [Actinomycetes bacterium]|nr:class I SAM-dependent methyltransferase [Actinomycetes bacterium]
MSADRSDVPEYVTLNKASWDERAAAHAASPEYRVQQFLDDPDYLSDVVRFDLPLLGSIAGQRGVHLQCHIGTDTLSLARLGASMTGFDFSAAALAEARSLAEATGASIDFVEGDVYDAHNLLGPGRYDFVFTGIGALCWLPSVSRWARVVADLLRPGGRLFIREAHPMLWAMDESRAEELVVGYPYFETEEPIVEDEEGTYVQTDVTFQHNLTHSWNHGLGELVTSLLDVGMTVTGLVEHDSVPWEALPGQMVLGDDGEWRLREQRERLACTYTLQAVKGPVANG